MAVRAVGGGGLREAEGLRVAARAVEEDSAVAHRPGGSVGADAARRVAGVRRAGVAAASRWLREYGEGPGLVRSTE